MNEFKKKKKKKKENGKKRLWIKSPNKSRCFAFDWIFLLHFVPEPFWQSTQTTTDGMAHCILRTMGQRIAKKNIAGKERERATAKWTRTSSRTTLILPDDSDSSHLHLTGLLTVIFGGRGAIDCATHFTANNGQVKITHTIIANQKNTSACLCLCPSKLSLSLSFPL